ncbi:MAG TPA: methyltransferase [Nitrospirota bacterium]|nr:methyltransferase [Nitrospirota bacterium]
MNSFTHDQIALRGAGMVNITQPEKGARFTLDSLLLADFCRFKPRDAILEPGSGTGVISLLLAKKYPRASVVSVEVQATVAKLCSQNIADNGLDGRIVLLNQDIREIHRSLKPASFDAIVANPPYSRIGTGRQSPVQDRSTSRHDRLGTIQAWLDLRIFLRNRGRYFLVFPAGRTAEILSLLRAGKLEPKRIRFVHTRQDNPALLILIEAMKSAGPGLEVLAPLIVHEAGGFSPEMRQIYDAELSHH